MKIDETEGEKVDYFYADFYTILAFSEGLFGCERNAATNTLDELFIGCPGRKFSYESGYF